MEQSFIAFLEDSIKKNWDLDALTDYKGATLQYKDVARKIEKLHIIFELSGIKQGDKIAVCGRNSSHWGVTFLAAVTYGAVIVPILHEFKSDNIHNIVNHSEARLLMVGDMVWENLNENAMPLLEGVILMNDYTLLVSRSSKLDYARDHLNELFGKKYPRNFRREHVSYRRDTPEELAVINYTSGTTSYSKGVMIPYRALWSNTQFAFDVLKMNPGDKLVSMLPMAHMYGLAFEFLYEFCVGCHIYFLTRTPSPKIIFQAFSEVKPNLVVAVPLIIEKIIKKNVLPKLETPAMKILLKVPIINDKIKATVREQMMLHIIFELSGIKQGDKIAVCGRNSSHWGVTFLAAVTYGAVIVPILHEFKSDNIHNIVNHSEARLLMVGDMVWENLNENAMPLLEGVILMNDYTLLVSRSSKLDYARDHLNELFGKKYPRNFRREHVSYRRDTPEELAVINYTSGTTSYSKGVMIPYRALWSNTQFAFDVLKMNPGDKLVSMLPMAHMYGLAFEFLYEFCVGCHIYFLTRTPSPKIIFQAFSEVKPNLVVAVPLIIEKIIKKNVLPKLETPAMKILLKVPIINDKIKATVREQMINAFGGNFYEIIVGGAAFNQEIEQFLKSIDFPYTVGYGMTECAPIICYEDWKYFKPGSCGKAAPRMEVKILSPDPENIVGEIVCKGPNVMLGYYKNPEATAEVIDKDGWLHTGDLGVMDAEGNVTIKGRSKNMLLGPSGQNIYPEEIEDKLNNMPFVSESIIIQQADSKLAALVYPDFDDAFAHGLDNDAIAQAMEENRINLNTELPAYSQIARVKIYPEEFEKTPKKSIKRFLYQEVK